jgi:hypothetical protein
MPQKRTLAAFGSAAPENRVPMQPSKTVLRYLAATRSEGDEHEKDSTGFSHRGGDWNGRGLVAR